MKFQKGQSGNPSGTRKDLPWRDALMRALKRRATDDDPQLLERVADAVVAAAIDGDMQAAKEIGDRLDGKAVQAVESTTEVTHYVVRMPSKPESIDDWHRQHGPQVTVQ